MSRRIVGRTAPPGEESLAYRASSSMRKRNPWTVSLAARAQARYNLSTVEE